MEMVNITYIIEAVIALIFAIITAFIIPLIKSRIDENKLAELSKWVKIAVEAAEQIFDETGLGEKKKAYVTNFLANIGYTVDYNYIENLIESEVYKLKSKGIE